jgi:chromosome condensin MukBEF MukE localization factor
MFKIQQNKEKLVLVMTQDEQDDNFANALKKFEKHKRFRNILKDFRVKVAVNEAVSEFSTEIQDGQDLSEAMQRLVSAKLATYSLFHQLEQEESEENKEEDACPFDELLDKCEAIVVIIPNSHDDD